MLEETKATIALTTGVYFLLGGIAAFEQSTGNQALFVFFLWPIATLISIYRGFIEFVKGE